MAQGAMFDEFVETGFLDDAQVTVKSARFATWDYRGKQSPVLALNLKLEDTEGKEHDEYLSSGELKFFVPSDDGKQALPVGSQQKLNSNTNAAAFIMSIFNADTKGELAAKLKSTDDISILDGTVFHVVRKAQPKRSGLLTQEGEGKRPATRLEVDAVVKYAWEAGSGTAAKTKAAATATASAPAAAAAGNEELDFTTLGVLMEILGANGNSIKKTAVAGKVFSNATVKAMPPAERNALLAHIVKEDFLKGETAAGAGIQFDGTTISAA